MCLKCVWTTKIKKKKKKQRGEGRKNGKGISLLAPQKAERERVENQFIIGSSLFNERLQLWLTALGFVVVGHAAKVVSRKATSR